MIINPAGDPPPRPTSIGTAGRLRSEQVADINRNARPTSSESATIRAKYELPTGVTAPQTYVYHCHILEHEDNDMMRPFTVIPQLQ